MKRHFVKPLSLACLSVVVAACGATKPHHRSQAAGPHTTASRAAETVLRDALQGNWTTGCKASPPLLQALAAGNIKATNKSLQIENNSIEYIKTYFLDENCAMPIGQLVQHGQYKEGDALANGQNSKALDILIQKTDFVVHSPEAAKVFNELKICGLEGWTPDQVIDITGKDCIFGGMPAANTTHYTAYKVENDSLYMGDYDCSEGETGCRSITTAVDADVGRQAALKVVYKKQ